MLCTWVWNYGNCTESSPVNFRRGPRLSESVSNLAGKSSSRKRIFEAAGMRSWRTGFWEQNPVSNAACCSLKDIWRWKSREQKPDFIGFKNISEINLIQSLQMYNEDSFLKTLRETSNVSTLSEGLVNVCSRCLSLRLAYFLEDDPTDE